MAISNVEGSCSRQIHRTEEQEKETAATKSAQKNTALESRTRFEQSARPEPNQPDFGALGSAPLAQPPSMAQQVENSVKGLQAEAAVMQRLSNTVNHVSRQIPQLHRHAEVITGAAKAANSVTALNVGIHAYIATRNPDLLNDAVKEAGKAGEYMAGELSTKIKHANDLYTKFAGQYIQYMQINRNLQAAVRTQDFDAMKSLHGQKDVLMESMKQTARSFEVATNAVAKMDKEFESATRQAALGALISAAIPGDSGLVYIAKEIVSPMAAKNVDERLYSPPQ